MLVFATMFVAASALAQTTSMTEAPGDKHAAPEVVQFDATKVNASFAQGAVLVKDSDGRYLILTARREKPGQAELHTKYTDLIYIVEGTATFVTGGEVIEGKTTAPDEIRGASIKNGISRKLAKGDVIIVPNGIPHQFVEVSNPFLYYVVKVK
ncbi:MAG TPA: cupin domain-containing protein [Terriglobales bacterium]|jgi:glc operon protein GlcG